MPFDSFVFLCFSAPVSFPLRSYERPTIVMLIALFCSVLTYVPVKSWTVYLILLKSPNVIVQLLFRFEAPCSIKSARVREIGGVELKVRRVVDQQLLQRS